MRESRIERHLVRRLRQIGGEAIKLGHSGWPDRLIVMPGGEIVWAELKATDGTLKPHQKRRIEWLRRHGQEVVVPNSIEAIEQRFPHAG